jgi:hypothetical protein
LDYAFFFFFFLELYVCSRNKATTVQKCFSALQVLDSLGVQNKIIKVD